MKIYIDDTECTAGTISNITEAVKNLKELEFVRVWHNNTIVTGKEDENKEQVEELAEAVKYLREVLETELKLERLATAETLTQFRKPGTIH